MAPSDYLVLDIETEGLDPSKHGILEVGAIAIDANLQTIAEFSEVCMGTEPRDLLDAFIRNMHGRNGLLDEIEGRIICGKVHTEQSCDKELADWILFQGIPPGRVVLAGNSVHFDHAFIKARMPMTAALLSHRVKDIGAIRRELEEQGFKFPKRIELPHRGLADARIELSEWRCMRNTMNDIRTFHQANYRTWG